MNNRPFPVIDLAATGRNIARLRRESGLSVADLQEYFGFEAPQAIYKWQKGKSLPSTDNLLALGQLLDVPMEKILITRSVTGEKMPQEESCGSHRFGAARVRRTGAAGYLILFSSQSSRYRSTASLPSSFRISCR